MPPATVLDLDDPYIGIVPYLAHKPCLDVGFRHWRLAAEDGGKYSAGRLRLVKDRLRRRAIQHAGAIEPVGLDEVKDSSAP